jgi:biotin synthase
MIRGIKAMNVEVCCCLGSLNREQAIALKEAGLYAYNHNIDTSRNYYPQVVTTRTYQERLDTLDCVEEADLSVCCGGILGLGESEQDRIEWIHTLATRSKHPDSVPINRLIAIPGTPLENALPVSIWEMVRTIATTRIVLPQAILRFAAGREGLSGVEQTLCFLAGINSIFHGEKLLTTPNSKIDTDDALMQILGVEPCSATPY